MRSAAVAALEVVAAEMVAVLQVADHGLDGGAALLSRRIALVVRRT
jgi:hypothetical protein